ncbi:VCBS repeat-containing protein [Aurantibacter crassamenti]|uniref:VCBS repeat-containing protein n=1 Tax=Aurantibacter crassamenti TaxID=1837375 RepID=UPI00193AC0D0|nr:VCBS repeat-containing protein [Aurantibacter crassamenti]MBM1104754.1 VCBS repeat-containing protein [Aurantibacter crassamenti]
MKKTIVFLILAFYIVACNKKNTLFDKINSTITHVDFTNQLSPTTELNILSYLYYYNGAGIAAADFNNDGLIDLFFTGNQVNDELYLNRGDFQFEKITKQAGFQTKNSWSTGVTHVDINNDGLLDIYICKASKYRALEGQNLLYINKGIDSNGIPSFKEESKKYGLDFSGLSTNATFFDYDLDGDLDMYLLNHSVHPNNNYGHGSKRKGYNPISGDVLFKNQNGKFVDTSEEAGIFQGEIGYGLGLAISDINNDGYPDIYIGNDFFENDYLYINQKNGKFNEVNSQKKSGIGHTSHYSMGNDIADINNDGLMDIISLDMLPENLETYKSSGLEYSYSIYNQYLNKNYAPQYMQNTLQLNNSNNQFSEIAFLSGIAATEWSWGALFADFNNDGYNDLFVSNGIKGATNDMDYLNFISNDDIQRRIDAGMKESDLPLITEIPEKKTSNYIFKNNGDLTFSNMTHKWLEEERSFSNGSIYADLDNDGDLDLVINNVNQEAFILENKTKVGNYLNIKFNGSKNNLQGIGAKVTIYSDKTITKENYTSRGYLSSIPPNLHFGFGTEKNIDSLKVQWPDGKTETLKSINTNTTITLNYTNAKVQNSLRNNQQLKYFTKKDSLINFKHKEQASLDFDRKPLIPFANSNNGPCISVADINNDGLEDVFIGGAKKQTSALLIQTENGEFINAQDDLFEANNINEDTASLFFDANGDGYLDLVVGSGGNEFTSGTAIEPRLYINENGTFKLKKEVFKNIRANISKIAAADIDNDGDIDLILAADQVPTEFGLSPKQHLFLNDGNGNFIDKIKKIAPQLENIGNIKDLVFADINHDNKTDLIVVGHWMPVSIFLNNGNQLILQENNGLEFSKGWWNSLNVTDVDNDGDLDFICGNWGLNSKFNASKEKPITLYRNDFDTNGSIEVLVTYFYNDIETTFASKDDLVKQLPFLNKKYLSYNKFAKASIKELFGGENLNNSDKKQVYELQSSVFINDGDNNFTIKSLPLIAQSSQINSIAVDDVNNDGYDDLILAGNNYQISTQLGRLDGCHGLILQNDKKGGFSWVKEQNLDINGVSRTIKNITVDGVPGYLIGRNNSTPIVLLKTK